MRDKDALLTPMLPITARPVAEVDETTYYLSTWSRAVNYVGACAITVPAGLSKAGLPIGMQLVGAGGSDDRIVALAAMLERAAPQRPRPPAP
jgi:aspartyl-tRNA(Asn)/glutamyl-tRNA(Gln) amidotransferase subunit A